MGTDMSKQIKDTVKQFNSENGNENFTVKELVIYFNKQHEERMDRLEERIGTLPCEMHMQLIAELVGKMQVWRMLILPTITGIVVGISIYMCKLFF